MTDVTIEPAGACRSRRTTFSRQALRQQGRHPQHWGWPVAQDKQRLASDTARDLRARQTWRDWQNRTRATVCSWSSATTAAVAWVGSPSPRATRGHRRADWWGYATRNATRAPGASGNQRAA